MPKRKQPSREYKIQRTFIDHPKLLSEQLEALMAEHARRANRAAEDMRTNAELTDAQRLTADHAYWLNEGYRHGLNKAWKLLFGIETFEDLEEQ